MEREALKKVISSFLDCASLHPGYYSSAMILRGGGGGVIPGEHRETRNPGGVTTGKCLILLDASLRWHDEVEPIRISEMDHYFYFAGLSPTCTNFPKGGHDAK